MSAALIALAISLGSIAELEVGETQAGDASLQVEALFSAIKEMEAGTCRTLTGRTGPHDAEMAEIAVVDTGIGIAPEIADDQFPPFVTTKRRGLGVGLSICRTIVEGHGGSIWAVPGPDGGTVLHSTLPPAPPG